MKLNQRDKDIMNYIRKQDFCFYKDILKKFFPSYASGSRRLNKLQKNGYLRMESVREKNVLKNLDKRSLNLVERSHKIISLKKSHLDSYEYLRLNQAKITHQIVLFALKEQLEKMLYVPAVFDNEIKERKGTLESGDHEPYPDLYFEGRDFKLAVELELHIKSQNRYDLKIIDYRNSSYSHVLYVVGTLRKKEKLLEYFAYKDGIGVSHYGEPEIVFSYSYGKLSLLEWLRKESGE